MLMLLSVYVTSVLFLVWFNNFALTMGFYWSYTRSYSSRPFLCALTGTDMIVVSHFLELLFMISFIVMILLIAHTMYVLHTDTVTFTEGYN